MKIVWDKKARDELKKLEFIIAQRIIKQIKKFSEDAVSSDVKQLKSSKFFRQRIGDYMVIFGIKKKKVNIVKIGHRKNIYE